MSTLKAKLLKFCQSNIVWDCQLNEYTTLKVGGLAEALIKPGSTRELKELICTLNKQSIPWQVIGKGSNVVISDDGIEGVVIVLGENLASIKLMTDADSNHHNNDTTVVRVEAGCSLTKLTQWCAKHSLAGLEFMAGIPASVGGAVSMNAGAWGHEIKDVVCSVEVITVEGVFQKLATFPTDFSYRKWKKREGHVIVAALFKLFPAVSEEIKCRCQELIRKRNNKQPKGVASAGSFFKNPGQLAAGSLIEESGLKGLRVGGAEVSKKHANFFINTGNATARDFYDLMKLVQGKVFEKFAVQLEPEVKFLGRWC